MAALGVAGLMSAKSEVPASKKSIVKKEDSIVKKTPPDGCVVMYLSCTVTMKCGAKGTKELLEYLETAEDVLCGN